MPSHGWIWLCLCLALTGGVAGRPLAADASADSSGSSPGRAYSAWRINPAPATSPTSRSRESAGPAAVSAGVRQAGHSEPLPAPAWASGPWSSPKDGSPNPAREGDSRGLRLAPPGQSLRAPSSDKRGLGTARAVSTVISSLAIVIGAFLVLAWFARRAMPKGNQRVPEEVVQLLGRMPLDARRQLQLLRFGNKLLLLHVSPQGVESLGEITDADEVQRLAGICVQQRPDSISATFRDVLQQLGEEPPGGARRTLFPVSGRASGRGTAGDKESARG